MYIPYIHTYIHHITYIQTYSTLRFRKLDVKTNNLMLVTQNVLIEYTYNHRACHLYSIVTNLWTQWGCVSVYMSLCSLSTVQEVHIEVAVLRTAAADRKSVV